MIADIQAALSSPGFAAATSAPEQPEQTPLHSFAATMLGQMEAKSSPLATGIVHSTVSAKTSLSGGSPVPLQQQDLSTASPVKHAGASVVEGSPNPDSLERFSGGFNLTRASDPSEDSSDSGSASCGKGPLSPGQTSTQVLGSSAETSPRFSSEAHSDASAGTSEWSSDEADVGDAKLASSAALTVSAHEARSLGKRSHLARAHTHLMVTASAHPSTLVAQPGPDSAGSVTGISVDSVITLSAPVQATPANDSQQSPPPSSSHKEASDARFVTGKTTLPMVVTPESANSALVANATNAVIVPASEGRRSSNPSTYEGDDVAEPVMMFSQAHEQPLSAGTTWPVAQGTGGSFSHSLHSTVLARHGDVTFREIATAVQDSRATPEPDRAAVRSSSRLEVAINDPGLGRVNVQAERRNGLLHATLIAADNVVSSAPAMHQFLREQAVSIHDLKLSAYSQQVGGIATSASSLDASGFSFSGGDRSSAGQQSYPESRKTSALRAAVPSHAAPDSTRYRTVPVALLDGAMSSNSVSIRI